MDKGTFELGHTYTRRAIHEAVGGEVQSYLPRHRGRVVCGCFTQTLNPPAPDIVLVGNAPNVIKSAKQFAGQSEAVPVFLKQKSNAWEYVGNFVVDRYSEDPAEIAPLAKKANRPDAMGVLFLKR